MSHVQPLPSRISLVLVATFALLLLVAACGGSAPQPTPGPAATATPAPSEAHATYVVQPGENLWAISERFYGNGIYYMDIFEANRDQLQDPTKLQPGMILKIPPKPQ